MMNASRSPANESPVEMVPRLVSRGIWLVLPAFWLSGWLATCVAGSLFGAFAGPPGVVIGFFIAAIVGAPIHLAACLLTMVGPLVRFRYLVAMLAGGLTGIFSVKAAEMAGTTAMIIAGVIGGVATLVGLRWIVRKTWLSGHRQTIVPLTYQFSIRDAFVFLTIVAVVSAAAAYAPTAWEAWES